MTQHKILKNKQHEPYQKLWVISGAPKPWFFENNTKNVGRGIQKD